jgi:glycosyltransferase involved in cell wall biosynthesis
MKITNLTYATINEYTDPFLWLKRIDFFVALQTRLARYGAVSSVHCINYEGVVSAENVNYHFLRLNQWQTIFPIRLNEYVKSLQPDVVIVHGWHHAWKIIMLKLTLPKSTKILVQHHAEKFPGILKRLVQRWADQYISGYLFTSVNLAEPWLSASIINKKEKVYEVMEMPSGLVPLDRALAKTITGIKGFPVYLWVGRLDANKDPITLVRAFTTFLKENRTATLCIIYHDGELEKVVSKIINDSDVSERIVLKGKVEHAQMAAWYGSSDFIVSTSHYEGSGIAVCEAMTGGCVPILSEIPSFIMMTKNGGCGLLFKAGDELRLLDALRASVTVNMTLEREKVLTQVNEALSPDAIARKIAEISASILAGK